MLILLTIIFAILGAWALFKKRNFLGISALVVMLLCQVFILLDATQHFGTSTYTTSHVEKIAPVTDIKGNQIMITEKIKQGKTEFLAYATKKPGESEVHTVLNKHKSVKVFSDHPKYAYKETSNNKYRYNSAFYQFLFTGITNSGQQKSQTITYHLTSSWHALSKDQLKHTGKVLKEPKTQATIKSEVASVVQNQIKQDPSLKQNDTRLKNLEDKALSQSVGKILEQSKS
ncbi:DUF4811 domain-containing protein [Companilactobacillus ginsenosidimutans]|uniref:DUF4811 domain-containing protein n=1 Tax=Companilactobacillus ginsenosidimutans TaxID=1007676 RepID=A0A0H4QGX9_9LACO|nr:DUF4811 domain-containing protein [Companilactobacillus ginsenosidimutans]AKP67669.1 hypothetical protein ABM34_09105 [Companilactobacillus ginsenosidimutans]